MLAILPEDIELALKKVDNFILDLEGKEAEQAYDVLEQAVILIFKSLEKNYLN